MKPQQAFLLAAGAAGLLAVGAGLLGINWLAGSAAAILLLLFLLIPWMNQERP